MRIATQAVTFCFAIALLGLPLFESDGADSKAASDMIRVPAGPFLMGSNNGPEDSGHSIKLTSPSFSSTELK